jgi:hypothetical protein
LPGAVGRVRRITEWFWRITEKLPKRLLSHMSRSFGQMTDVGGTHAIILTELPTKI